MNGIAPTAFTIAGLLLPLPLPAGLAAAGQTPGSASTMPFPELLDEVAQPPTPEPAGAGLPQPKVKLPTREAGQDAPRPKGKAQREPDAEPKAGVVNLAAVLPPAEPANAPFGPPAIPFAPGIPEPQPPDASGGPAEDPGSPGSAVVQEIAAVPSPAKRPSTAPPARSAELLQWSPAPVALRPHDFGRRTVRSDAPLDKSEATAESAPPTLDLPSSGAVPLAPPPNPAPSPAGHSRVFENPVPAAGRPRSPERNPVGVQSEQAAPIPSRHTPEKPRPEPITPIPQSAADVGVAPDETDAEPTAAPAAGRADGPAPPASDPRRVQLAFAARLTPLPPTAPDLPAETAQPPRSEAPARPGPRDPEAHPIARVRKPEAAEGANDDAAPRVPDPPGIAPVRGGAIAAAGAPGKAVAVDRRMPEPALPPAVESEHQVREAARPQAHETVAHDIRLELAGTDRRVEVRLQERAGEVRVAVRTPDGNLAEALRDQLPSLSARLEQSGFRADQWRAADPAGGQRPLEEPAGNGGMPDARQHSGGHGGQQQQSRDSSQEQPRHPRDGGASGNRNQKGKGFAWLISSLQ